MKFFLLQFSLFTILISCKNAGEGLIIIEQSSALGKKQATRPLFECYIDSFYWQPTKIEDSLFAATSTIEKSKGKNLLRINAENRDGNDSIGTVLIMSIRIDAFLGEGIYDKQSTITLQNTIKVRNGSKSISYLSDPGKTKLIIEKYDSVGMLISGKFESALHQFAPANDSARLQISKGKFENLPLFIAE